MTWILILMVVTSAHSVSLQAISGFKTEEACLVTAKQWEKSKGAYTSTHYGICLRQEK